MTYFEASAVFRGIRLEVCQTLCDVSNASTRKGAYPVSSIFASCTVAVAFYLGSQLRLVGCFYNYQYV